MNKVLFNIDYSFGAGGDELYGGNLPGRYEMLFYLTDEEKAELEEVALTHNPVGGRERNNKKRYNIGYQSLCSVKSIPK